MDAISVSEESEVIIIKPPVSLDRSYCCLYASITESEKEGSGERGGEGLSSFFSRLFV